MNRILVKTVACVILLATSLVASGAPAVGIYSRRRLD